MYGLNKPLNKIINILLIEDNPGDADLTKETLEFSKLFLKVTVAMDGVDAIDYLLKRSSYANAETPDLILLDLNLPKKDGRQVLAEIKNYDHLSTIPVIILTSSDAEKDIVQSYEFGANCYITKPVDLKAFQAIVKSIESFWFTIVKLP